MWHRHRPADAWGGLRLHRLDHHLADLRFLHFHFFRDRSRNPGFSARDVLRHSPPDRLSHQRGGDHSAGDIRHHADQPLPALDAAALDCPAHHAVCGHRLRQPAFVYAVAELCRRARQPRWPPRPVSVRHGGLGGVFAGRADRRAGRFPALSAARSANVATKLVDCADRRWPGLDRARCAEATRRLLPRFLRHQPWRVGRACRRARAYVSPGVPVCVVAT
jgi:hypothetical protein